MVALLPSVQASRHPEEALGLRVGAGKDVQQGALASWISCAAETSSAFETSFAPQKQRTAAVILCFV